MYAKLENGSIQQYPYNIQQLYGEYPTTSFPTHMTPEVLAAFDIVIVVGTGAPEHNTITQNAVEGTPAYSTERSRWEQTWVIVDATPEQIAEREAQARTLNSAQAKTLLEATDWSQLGDVVSTLENRQEFDSYRVALRAIVIDPPVTITEWPTKPSAVWV